MTATTSTSATGSGPAAKADAPLMLSVSGARGIVGKSMTPDTAWHLAAAFGMEIQRATNRPDPLIVIGRDSRPSSEMLGAAAVAGLFAVGCRVLRLGCVTTPTAGVMIDHHRADGGIVITASHNPIEWNGLKCLNSRGVAPPPDDAARIIDRFKARDLNLVPGDVPQPMRSDLDGSVIHVQRIMKSLDIEPIRRAGFRVILDSVNGAGCVAGRLLLEECGVELVHMNGEPTGRFAHTPEPIRENLTDLADTVRREKAHIGFAQDPDADRLAIVDERGQYIGEEYTLVLAAESLLGLSGGDSARGVKFIATNLSTSRMMNDVADRHGATLVRTPVGEANVVNAMRTHEAMVGGEGNGGVIWPVVCGVRDSLSGMALVLSLLARTGKPLSELIAGWPTYHVVKSKVEIQPGMAERAITQLESDFAGESINRDDGIRIEFAAGSSHTEFQGAWLHVRASNTEPILRLLAEAPTQQAADSLISHARSLMNS